MLASVLALAIGLGSLALYAIAFLLPTLHRKSDFLWSGVGLFYALVLWVCAGQIRGGVLLGQTASVTLLGWFGWQMLKLRWELIPVRERPPLPSASSAPELFNHSIAWVRGRVTGEPSTVGRRSQPPLQRPGTPLRGPGPKSGRPMAERHQPVAARYADLDSLGGLPEYELVEPEPVMMRPFKPRKPEALEPVVEAVEAEPVADAAEDLIDQPVSVSPVETEPDLPDLVEPPASPPVPSVQPSTLKSRTKATPASSPIETAQAILTSLKEGAQQFWRSLSGRKPPRPMIVLDRTKSAPVSPATSTDVEDDFDFDFDTDTADTSSNEVELAPNVETAVMPEEAIAIEDSVAEVPDSGVDESGEPGDEPVAEIEGVDAAVTDSDLEVESDTATPVEDSVDKWDEAIATLDTDVETVSTSKPTDDIPVPADEPVDAITDTVEIADASESEEVPVLVRPNPPDPELVAEAIADATEKDLPADPPDSAEPEEIHPA